MIFLFEDVLDFYVSLPKKKVVSGSFTMSFAYQPLPNKIENRFDRKSSSKEAGQFFKIINGHLAVSEILPPLPTSI